MRIFVDGGAHTGEVFHWLDLSSFDKVYLVEPNHEFWDQIKDMGTLCPFALSDEDGTAPFYSSLRTDLGHSLLGYKGEEPMDTKNPTQAQTVDVGPWLESISKPGDRITIKLDIEGAEYRVLDRLLGLPVAERVERLFVEWHPIPGLIEQKADLIKRMADIAYEEWPH